MFQQNFIEVIIKDTMTYKIFATDDYIEKTSQKSIPFIHISLCTMESHKVYSLTMKQIF